MLSKRTQQAFFFTALAAFILCSSSSTSVQAAQLRVSSTKQRQQSDQDESVQPEQPDNSNNNQRQLGSVIIVDTSGSDQYNLDSSYPQYTPNVIEPAIEQTPVDYNDILPAVRSGPHPSDTKIDIKYKPEKSDSEHRQDLYASDRVVGGFGVGPRTWYSMLLYKDSSGWKFAGCGATLITNCHVLTAAHCVEDRNFDIEGIYNNAHTPYDGNSNNPFHFTTASRIFVPQEYDDYTNVNDIAVIRMSECVNITEYPPAVPASPYNSHVSDGELLELYGFGRVGENLGQSGDTKQLQMAQLPYISNEQCKNYFGNKIRYGMFCAGFAQGGVDACQGDSGSGLFQRPQNNNDPYIVTGIVSWGVGCARPGYPGVYAKVSDFYEWIKTNTCNDPQLDPSIRWCTDAPPANTLMLRQSDCSQNSPCGACEGECSDDKSCSGDLVCFTRNGNIPFALIPGCVGTGVATRNYCYDPNLSRFSDNAAMERNQETLMKEAVPEQSDTRSVSDNNGRNPNSGNGRRNKNGRRRRRNGGKV